MQNRVIRLDAYSRRANPQTRIRRSPQADDQRLAEAIRVLHEQGPRVLCELWDEVAELESRLSTDANNTPISGEAKAMVDRLRGE